MNKKDKIFLIFSDTDVFVLALNFWDIFAARGLKVLVKELLCTNLSFAGILDASWYRC